MPVVALAVLPVIPGAVAEFTVALYAAPLLG
jgi:hypothetical protein